MILPGLLLAFVPAPALQTGAGPVVLGAQPHQYAWESGWL
jgi:hypothetical protein